MEKWESLNRIVKEGKARFVSEQKKASFVGAKEHEIIGTTWI